MRYKIIKPPKNSNFVLTYHAAEQYVSRWFPEKSIKEAEKDLYFMLNSVKKVDKSPKGDDIYSFNDSPDIRFVVKDKNVCVTILPPVRNKRQQMSDVEYYQTFIGDYEDIKPLPSPILIEEFNKLSVIIGEINEDINKMNGVIQSFSSKMNAPDTSKEDQVLLHKEIIKLKEQINVLKDKRTPLKTQKKQIAKELK